MNIIKHCDALLKLQGDKGIHTDTWTKRQLDYLDSDDFLPT